MMFLKTQKTNYIQPTFTKATKRLIEIVQANRTKYKVFVKPH